MYLNHQASSLGVTFLGDWPEELEVPVVSPPIVFPRRYYLSKRGRSVL